MTNPHHSSLRSLAIVLLGCLLITRLSRRISLEGARAGIEEFVKRTERIVVRRSRVGLGLAVVYGVVKGHGGQPAGGSVCRRSRRDHHVVELGHGGAVEGRVELEVRVRGCVLGARHGGPQCTEALDWIDAGLAGGACATATHASAL